MEKYFKNEQKELVNVIEHTLDQINKCPTLKIYIGTDSQNYSHITRYVTAIVFRYGLRGAHYIYFKEDVPRVRAEYLRLYDEGVRTIQTWEMLTSEIPISVDGLEFDYSDIKKTISSKLVQDFKGWVTGLQQKAIFKSGQMIATKAADHLCRKS
jgi:predicted RNase H-related nuclease YkuK (DUF458 family)